MSDLTSTGHQPLQVDEQGRVIVGSDMFHELVQAIGPVQFGDGGNSGLAYSARLKGEGIREACGYGNTAREALIRLVAAMSIGYRDERP